MGLFGINPLYELIIYIIMGAVESIVLGLFVWFKFVVTNKLELTVDPKIKKINYLKTNDNKKLTKEEIKNKLSEFKFDKRTDLLPTKWGRLTIIMLSDDKGITFLYRNFDTSLSTFRYKKGKYIIETEGIYTARNGARTSVYIEGISVPLRTSYVEKIIKNIKYKEVDGTEKIATVQLIKGLRFDSKIFDTFSNREFAEIFTKTPHKGLEYLKIILLVIILIISAINSLLIYYFR